MDRKGDVIGSRVRHRSTSRHTSSPASHHRRLNGFVDFAKRWGEWPIFKKWVVPLLECQEEYTQFRNGTPQETKSEEGWAIEPSRSFDAFSRIPARAGGGRRIQ